MGMALQLHAVGDGIIDKILANPALVHGVAAFGDPEFADTMTRAAGGDPSDLVLGPDDVEETDLDKAWHGIHYLLTQSAAEAEPPLNFLLEGGEEVGDVEVGYGPARALRADEVAAIDRALAPIGADVLRGRFDPDAMQALDIYPEGMWKDEDDTALDYALYHYAALKDFVANAARQGRGLVITLV